jgi:hypothetical protein
MMADSSSHVEQDPVGTQTSGADEAFEWRRQQYEAMTFDEERAFSETEAIALAKSMQPAYTGGKDRNSKKVEWTSIPLSWQKVQKALEGGCTPALALEIFLTV